MWVAPRVVFSPWIDRRVSSAALGMVVAESPIVWPGENGVRDPANPGWASVRVILSGSSDYGGAGKGYEEVSHLNMVCEGGVFRGEV